MIPQSTFTADARPAAYLPPLLDSYDPLAMRAPGGIALGDTSQGRAVQFWLCRYTAGLISLTPALPGPAFTLAVPDVTSVCAAFDSSMNPVLAYTTPAGAHLVYRDPASSTDVTLHIPGATSCRVCVDQPDARFADQADVVFSHVNGGILFWRQQRDGFAFEHLLAPVLGEVVRLGPTVAHRLQIQVERPPPPPPHYTPPANDLPTAVRISLFTDAEAWPDDVIPDGSGDPRGWWGDVGPYAIGSRLWLIDRAKQTAEVLALARSYAEEALQWMIDDGVVARFDIDAEWTRPSMLGLHVTAWRRDGTREAMNFAWAWQGVH